MKLRVIKSVGCAIIDGKQKYIKVTMETRNKKYIKVTMETRNKDFSRKKSDFKKTKRNMLG